jgi:hypothetical protein
MWPFPCRQLVQPGENSVQKLRISKQQFLNLIRKPHLAAIGHRLELPAFFPWFLLIPGNGGSAMIVWIADESGLLLRRA